MGGGFLIISLFMFSANICHVFSAPINSENSSVEKSTESLEGSKTESDQIPGHNNSVSNKSELFSSAESQTETHNLTERAVNAATPQMTANPTSLSDILIRTPAENMPGSTVERTPTTAGYADETVLSKPKTTGYEAETVVRTHNRTTYEYETVLRTPNTTGYESKIVERKPDTTRIEAESVERKPNTTGYEAETVVRTPNTTGYEAEIVMKTPNTTGHEDVPVVITPKTTGHEDESVVITRNTTGYEDVTVVITPSSTGHGDVTIVITPNTTVHEDKTNQTVKSSTEVSIAIIDKDIEIHVENTTTYEETQDTKFDTEENQFDEDIDQIDESLFNEMIENIFGPLPTTEPEETNTSPSTTKDITTKLPNITLSTMDTRFHSSSSPSESGEQKDEEENSSSSTVTVVTSLLITLLLAAILMIFCTRKKLSYLCFEPDIIKSVPANTQYRVIHKTERMVESLSNCTLQEDKSKLEFQILETLTEELVEPNSVTKEGLNLRNRNRYQNIIPYDKNIVRLNKKIGNSKILLTICFTFYSRSSTI